MNLSWLRWCAALSLAVITTASGLAQTNRRPSNLFGSILGKSKAQVEKLLGHGKQVGEKYEYLVKGFKTVMIEYGGEWTYEKLNGKVLSASVTFESVPKDWKQAFSWAGLSANGVKEGSGKAEGCLKNVGSIPIGFIGNLGNFKGQTYLGFTHWSYLSASTWPFTRVKGQ